MNAKEMLSRLKSRVTIFGTEATQPDMEKDITIEGREYKVWLHFSTLCDQWLVSIEHTKTSIKEVERYNSYAQAKKVYDEMVNE